MEVRCMKCDGPTNTGYRCIRCDPQTLSNAGAHTVPSPIVKRLADDARYLESKGFSIGSVREARRRIIDMERVCAEAYQIIGALLLDETTTPILDNLSAAAQGGPMPHKTCLPFVKRDVVEVADRQRALASVAPTDAD